ncbi:MAG: glutamate--tRNA ligase [Acidobacteria bacterium]|nr:MAG: glutamate--tRNA ligase [Acidobacteriota bacterium]
MPDIRVRFAPSPTGYLHVGGARTALYNWLFARHMNGVFILRIEDTDADRSKPELTTAILKSLEWLGLNWDEGPFHQSDRLDRYRALAADLERAGHAYPCFCTQEELQAKRSLAAGGRPWKYDGTCRKLPEVERQQHLADGIPHVVRFRVPETGETGFDDQVFGQIKVDNQEIEDFVLLRSDGQPTYHLGVVADDMDMRITHVVRGADHLSNTPKQILVYRAAGANLPVFAHLPLILGPDRQRLSKRHGATSVEAYRDLGILPEAMFNYLALLGWTPPGGEEILSREAMAQHFDLAAVSKSNAVFDPEKLAWMNSQYLRALAMDRLVPLVEAELKSARIDTTIPASPAEFGQTVALLQPRMRTLRDFSQGGRAFFTENFDYDLDARKKFWKDPSLPVFLNNLADRLDRLESFGPGTTENTLRAFAEESGIKAGLLINATRVALTGQAVAPGLFDVMNVLGKERTVARLRRAAKMLGEPGAGNT